MVDLNSGLRLKSLRLLILGRGWGRGGCWWEGAPSWGGLSTVLLEGDGLGTQRQWPAASRECVPCRHAVVNTKHRLEHTRHPSFLTLVQAAHRMVHGIREVYPAPVVLCFITRSFLSKGSAFCFLLTGEAFSFTCVGRHSAQTLHHRETSPRLKTVGIFETTNLGLRRPTAFKKLADFSC